MDKKKEQIEFTKQKVKDEMRDKIQEKEKEKEQMVREFTQYRDKRKEQIASMKQEMVNLYDLARRQHKAISDVIDGAYNNGIPPVVVPNDHLAAMPTRHNPEWKTLFRVLDENNVVTSNWGVERKNLGTTSMLNKSQRFCGTASSFGSTTRYPKGEHLVKFGQERPRTSAS